MKNKRILSIISAVLGSILIINSKTSILNVNLSPGSSENLSFILGLVLVVTGITMFEAVRKEEVSLEKRLSKEKYYKRRVNEIERDPSENDYWVSQWELKGLTKEFKKRGYNLRGPERDLGGSNSGPSEIRHINSENTS